MTTALGFRAFGKLPSRGDFLHIGASSAALAAFDDWLTQGVEWAHARAGAAFREAFTGSSIRAFVYVARSDPGPASLIIGALAPSRDEAGRQFPISVASSVALGTDFASEPQLLPIACEDIWQEASQCLAELLAGASEPSARLAALHPHPALDFADAQYNYSAWSEALPLAELWTLISASHSFDWLHDTLRWIAETVRPHRHQEAPNTRLAIRLPLGAAGGAAVCFWLDVVRRLSAWRSTVPSFFWSHDGVSDQLTVHMGLPAAASIAELWLPTRSRDEFCDLTVPLGGAALEHVSPLPAQVVHALSAPSSVAAFLATLS